MLKLFTQIGFLLLLLQAGPSFSQAVDCKSCHITADEINERHGQQRPKGAGEVDTRRVGSGNNSTNDRPAGDPRVNDTPGGGFGTPPVPQGKQPEFVQGIGSGAQPPPKP